jgi:uncharacterized protein (DUF2267 family)
MKIETPTLDISEIDFFYQIKKELSLESVNEAVSLVASVLHAVRQTLSLEVANNLLNKLPDFLKLVFASNWKHNEAKVQAQHLDELVCLLMFREKESRKSYFKNEVQALSVLILTLKQLDKIIDLNTFNGLSLALVHELREVPAEAAA